MADRLRVTVGPGVARTLAARVEAWAQEVVERGESPPFVALTLWRDSKELEDFYRREKEELGIVSEDAGFLATHEAWRGTPRVHLCQERLEGVPPEVVRGAIHHEMAHAALHGTPEFYTFRFTRELQDAAAGCGMDFPLLQQYVYFLSVAVKDGDVVRWLARIGLGSGQRTLLEFLLSETEDERRTWEAVRSHPPVRKLALAAFLKTLLPADALASLGEPQSSSLEALWLAAFDWLPEPEREALLRLAQSDAGEPREPFQTRIEQIALRLLADPAL